MNNSQEYIPDWAILFNQTADRMIENIDYLIAKL
jgi:hypothetical protein